MNRKRCGVSINRRSFLAALAVGTAGTVLSESVEQLQSPIKNGRVKQAVCLGVFRGSGLNLEGICQVAKQLGVHGIDLVGPDAFPVLKKYGLIPTMVPGGSEINRGINDKRNHDWIETRMRAAIKAAAEAGAPNVIVLAGSRKGISDEEGLENCVLFLNKIKAMAEDLGVTLCLELLNSKVDHPGYMADRTSWGVEVCKRVNSPRVKLLYDIYHMQIMEGDIIRTIRQNIQYIGHFHTAGNPGRHEFDDTQELNYRGICKAIADLGFQGYIAHEYTPTKDAIQTLIKMLEICDA